MKKKIVVVEPLPFWGSSHSETCYRICGPWHASGEDVTVHTGLVARPDPEGILRPSIPTRFPNAIKTRILERFGSKVMSVMEDRAIKQLRPGDFCYFWPGSGLAGQARARDAGAHVVVEFINSHRGLTREIMNREHLAWGFPPFALSDQDVDEDDQRVTLSDSIFAPGPLVGPSIRSRHPTLAPNRIIETSYGCFVPEKVPDRRGRKGPLTYLFVGAMGLRKGAPHLLNAWRKANLEGELWIAGTTDEAFKPLLAQLLPERVKLFPYISGINALYEKADIFIFPSLEEGGPQVTYEAAAFGLPLIVTKAGGGHINTPQTAIEVPPSSSDALAEAMIRMTEDHDLRMSLGEAARRASFHFAWDKVAERRLADLKRVAEMAH